MKKVVIILMLSISIITIASMETSDVCFAASYDSTHYYEATTALPVCNASGDVLFNIPYTYYFKVTGANETYYKIQYLSYGESPQTYYIEKADLNGKAVKTSLTEVTDPYYIMSLSHVGLTSIYDSSFSDSIGTLNITSLSYIGYTINNGTYYFYCYYTFNGGSGTNYVKTSDVTTNFSPSNITLHPNSAAAQEAKANAASRLAENKLKRNIFFFVTCILCVVVVILIYKPFQKKGATRAPSTYSGEDDF